MTYHTSVNSSKNSDQIWADMGALSEDEIFHVLTKLFAQYEARLRQDPGDAGALLFFHNLDLAIGQASQCNSTRR